MAGSARIAIIGVGNEFRHDDGVGWAVADLLEDRARRRPLPPGTVLGRCDTDPGRLMGLWEGAQLAIVVDAAHADPPRPGLIHRLEMDLDELSRPGATSSHGVGLGEAVELARVLGRLPDRLIVFAVEGADSTLGTGLSEPVAAVVAPLAGDIEDEIVRHRDAAARSRPRQE